MTHRPAIRAAAISLRSCDSVVSASKVLRPAYASAICAIPTILTAFASAAQNLQGTTTHARGSAACVAVDVPRSTRQSGTFRVPTSDFVTNNGQWPTPTQFLFRSGAFAARIEHDHLWLDLRCPESMNGGRVLLDLEIDGALPSSVLEGVGRSSGAYNFFLGADSARWATDVPAYAAVRWNDLRPGVSLTLGSSAGASILQYTIHCAPGTGPRPLSFTLRGADELFLDREGHLIARTALGDLRQTAPRAWEESIGGTRRDLPARFELLADSRFTIDVGKRDDALDLVIDPGLEWGGYVGGSGLDFGTDLALTAADEPVVVGYTDSVDFPTTPGVLQPDSPPGRDAFVMKVSADGSSIVFGTYIGGGGKDEAQSVAVDSVGSLVVVGRTYSNDFPMTPGAWGTNPTADDAFALKLSPNGSVLRFSTVFGGNSSDAAWETVIAEGGDIVVAGSTKSSNFPSTSGCVQSFLVGSWDGFITCIRGDGSALNWSSFFGGSKDDFIYALSLANDGSTVVGGDTHSDDFQTTVGAFDTVYGPHESSPYSGFVAKVSSDGSILAFSTYLDGNNSVHIEDVCLDSNGHIAATGQAQCSNFPVTMGAFDPILGTAGDAFVTIFTPDGANLVYSTGIGYANQNCGGAEVVLEDSGAFTLFGSGPISSFPTTPGAYDTFIGGVPDAFVMRFKPDGSAPLYSSLLGGNPGTDGAVGLALDATGRAVLLGVVTVGWFPVTPGAFDTTYGGGPFGAYHEGTLAKLELQPIGVTSFGTPTSACKGPIRLTALGEPKSGNAAFAIACTGAPPGSVGVLGIGGAALPAGLPVAGATVYLDLTQPITLLHTSANSLGYHEASIPIPAGTAGLTVFAQAGWIDTGGCTGDLTLSASDALQVSIANP